ncbi:4-coumarate-CoA ligase [Ilyonectria destructans]|nr:4-coumarate-CoA ligase [Ilyonectria destructans]
MTVYNLDRRVDVPKDQNLTQLLHSSHYDLPDSHLIAADSLTNRSITLGELRDRTGRIANGLKQKLNPPDQARWAIILPNSVEFMEVFHSILWTGGAICPINYALKATEIGHGIAVCRPQFIVAYGKILPAINEAIEVATAELKKEGVEWQPPTIITVIAKTAHHLHIPDDFLSSARLEIPHYPDTSKRLASIHLSSGTTGKPKGVCLTHYNFVANVHQLVSHDASQFHPASKTVAFTPWAHIAMTTMPMFLGPYTGMFHHAMPSYNLESFAKLVGSNQATSFQGVPSVVLSLAKSDMTERYDFSRAAILNVGGAPLKKGDMERLMSRAPWKMIQAFGMTEASGYVAYQRLDETLPEGSTGRLLPGIEARLVKEGTGNDAPLGGPGELWLRGPNITSGYAFNDEANKQGFPQDNWYNTGDVCTIDKEGRLSIVGRTKDLIKYKGFQVSPSELESYINSHPDVAEGGVAALWDESQLTEVPTAWVVLKPHLVGKSAADKKKSLRNVQSWIDEQVSGYKKLRGGVWEANKLPRNATGKILRKEMTGMRDGLSDTALKGEPGTLKYAALIPRDDDGKTVYAVEEYTDKAAFDLHMSTIGVKEINQWFVDEKVLDSNDKPDVHILEYLPEFRFDRQEVLTHADPHIAFAELDYIPGGVDTSIPYWKAVVNTGREDEPGTLVYGILKDSQKENRLCAFEVYESAEYLKDVHVPSEAIQSSINNTKHLRTGLKHHFLQKKGGFLYRK